MGDWKMRLSYGRLSSLTFSLSEDEVARLDLFLTSVSRLPLAWEQPYVLRSSVASEIEW